MRVHKDLFSTVKNVGNDTNLQLLYPNPSNGNVHLEFNNQQIGTTTIILFDEKGKETKTIEKKDIDDGINGINFSALNIPDGLYFIKVIERTNSRTFKLIIKK